MNASEFRQDWLGVIRPPLATADDARFDVSDIKVESRLIRVGQSIEAALQHWDTQADEAGDLSYQRALSQEAGRAELRPDRRTELGSCKKMKVGAPPMVQSMVVKYDETTSAATCGSASHPILLARSEHIDKHSWLISFACP
jgi:hypothetical protein